MKEDLIPYHKQVRKLFDKLESIRLEHDPRSANRMADAFASLIPTLALGAEENMYVSVCNQCVVVPMKEENEDVETIQRESEEEVDVIFAYQIDKEHWRQPIIGYLEHGNCQKEARHRMEICLRAPRFIYYKKKLSIVDPSMDFG
ncbi:Ectopic P granules protein 5-like protein [Bienertia sinuspersici]